MVYSCGYFTDWSNDIATAQRDKLDMICRKLRLQAGRHFPRHRLRLGRAGVSRRPALRRARAWRDAGGKPVCPGEGEGGEARFAGPRDDRTEGLHAARKAVSTRSPPSGCSSMSASPTTAAISRPSTGCCGRDGLYLHHAIARTAKADARRFRKKRPEAAAIARYIFPGGELDHIGMTAANLESSGFEVHDVEAWREHYARTCRLWHDRLLANREAAEREVGRDKTRLWLAYLAGVSIAFERNTLRIFQTLASRRGKGPVRPAAHTRRSVSVSAAARGGYLCADASETPLEARAMLSTRYQQVFANRTKRLHFSSHNPGMKTFFPAEFCILLLPAHPRAPS